MKLTILELAEGAYNEGWQDLSENQDSWDRGGKGGAKWETSVVRKRAKEIQELLNEFVNRIDNENMLSRFLAVSVEGTIDLAIRKDLLDRLRELVK